MGVAAITLAGCGGGDRTDSRIKERLQARLGDTYVVDHCVDQAFEQEGLRLYECRVVEPDLDEPREWNVAVNDAGEIVDASPK